MSDLDQWQRNNEAYLTAALAWLRLKLSAQSGSVVMPAAAVSEPESAGSWWSRRKSAATAATSEPPVIKLLAEPSIDLAAAEMAKAEAVDPPPPLIILARRFGLSKFEQQILLLCAAMELDTRTAYLCAHAQDDSGRPYPTFALALSVLDEPAWDALSPERPLRYWRLIEINQPGTQALTTSSLRADERVV